MSIKDKLMNKVIIKHPKLATFGIGIITISLVMVAILGLSYAQYASATPTDIIGGPLHHLTVHDERILSSSVNH
jgi:hypothetical protein